MVETMKKRIIMILAAACILVVSGCGAASVSQEAKTAETAADMQTTADIQQGLKLTTTEMDGIELRSVLDSNPSSITLYGFDEKEYEISDEKDIETIIDTLRNASYKEIDQQDYVEGLYQIDIHYDNETVSLGIGGDCVSYEGVQYDVEKGSLDKVMNIFAKYLN